MSKATESDFDKLAMFCLENREYDEAIEAAKMGASQNTIQYLIGHFVMRRKREYAIKAARLREKRGTGKLTHGEIEQLCEQGSGIEYT